jgi:regulator of protease activity HflC (stomatin/prohibitin superfamily)
MSLISELVRDLLGMFIDDRRLALVILGVVAVTGLASRVEDFPEGVVGTILVLGSVGALVESTLNAKSPRQSG